MAISLDDITRKKLILVRQLFQRAVLQAESQHSYVDRIMAIIGFDLSNETILKAVVSAINSSATLKNDFQGIVQQADNELSNNGFPQVPDKARIQHVRTIRNDAQHKAKYPNETDISDCRTYTRDFLKQIIQNVWGQDFDSISLIDAIQNITAKDFLIEAEKELKNGNKIEAVVNTKISLQLTFNLIDTSIVGDIPEDAEYMLIKSQPFGMGESQSSDLFYAFMHIRDLLLIQTIGLDLKGYIKYKAITEHIDVSFYEDGKADWNDAGSNFTLEDAEFVINFVTNAIIQIESLVGDISKPFNIEI